MAKSEHESEKQASDNEEGQKEKEAATPKEKKWRPDILYGKGGNSALCLYVFGFCQNALSVFLGLFARYGLQSVRGHPKRRIRNICR